MAKLAADWRGYRSDVAKAMDAVEDARQNFEMQLKEEPEAVGEAEKVAMKRSMELLEKALGILDMQHRKADRLLARGEAPH